MSHKLVLLAIDAKELATPFSMDMINEIVERKLEKYCAGKAENFNVKMDSFVVGGRWHGLMCAEKNASDNYPSKRNSLHYDFFDTYNLLLNGGDFGPYYIDDVEYAPITGARVKDIVWDYPGMFNAYTNYIYRKKVLEEDELFGGQYPDGTVFKDENLYAETENGLYLLIENNETFEHYCNRQNIEFQKMGFEIFDAFVDKNGVWHDSETDDIWGKVSKEAIKTKNYEILNNIVEYAKKEFQEAILRFAFEEHDPDDYLIIVDCHTFP